MTTSHSDRRPAHPLIAALLLAGAGAPAAGEVFQTIPVPSGQPVVLDEVINDRGAGGLVYRFRFLAPHVATGIPYAEAEADMAHLCETYALPRLPETGPRPSRVVISLADRPVDFGEMSPEATQFFEAYAPEDGVCVWQGL